MSGARPADMSPSVRQNGGTRQSSGEVDVSSRAHNAVDRRVPAGHRRLPDGVAIESHLESIGDDSVSSAPDRSTNSSPSRCSRPAPHGPRPWASSRPSDPVWPRPRSRCRPRPSAVHRGRASSALAAATSWSRWPAQRPRGGPTRSPTTASSATCPGTRCDSCDIVKTQLALESPGVGFWTDFSCSTGVGGRRRGIRPVRPAAACFRNDGKAARYGAGWRIPPLNH